MTELKGANRFDYEVVKLMRLVDTDDMMLQMFEVGLNAVKTQMLTDDPDCPAEEFFRRVLQRFDIDNLLYQFIPLYSRYYTRDEIVALIAFYESPIGKKALKTLPNMAQESIAAFQPWWAALVEKTMNEMES